MGTGQISEGAKIKSRQEHTAANVERILLIDAATSVR
jgi:hypothetical protein